MLFILAFQRTQVYLAVIKSFLRKSRRKYADGKCVIRDLTYCSAGWANLSEILLAGMGDIWWLVFAMTELVEVGDGDSGFHLI